MFLIRILPLVIARYAIIVLRKTKEWEVLKRLDYTLNFDGWDMLFSLFFLSFFPFLPLILSLLLLLPRCYASVCHRLPPFWLLFASLRQPSRFKLPHQSISRFLPPWGRHLTENFLKDGGWEPATRSQEMFGQAKSCGRRRRQRKELGFL